MKKVQLSDHLYSGSSFSGRLTIEDLIPLGIVACCNNTVHCVISREKLKEEFERRSQDFKLDDFRRFVDFVFDEPIVVQNTYFNIETSSFEEQQVIFTLMDN